MIFVLTGLDNVNARREESEKIVNWAFRQFAQKQVVSAGTELARAEVWMGDALDVGLVVPDDVSLLVPTLTPESVKASVEFSGPVAAPIAEGQALGELVVDREGLPQARFPLVSSAAVAKGGFGVRLRTAAQVLIAKVAPAPETAQAATN